MTAYWRERLAEGARWADAGLAREGLRLFEELPRTANEHVLLATDLHAGNVLRAAARAVARDRPEAVRRRPRPTTRRSTSSTASACAPIRSRRASLRRPAGARPRARPPLDVRPCSRRVVALRRLAPVARARALTQRPLTRPPRPAAARAARPSTPGRARRAPRGSSGSGSAAQADRVHDDPFRSAATLTTAQPRSSAHASATRPTSARRLLLRDLPRRRGQRDRQRETATVDGQRRRAESASGAAPHARHALASQASTRAAEQDRRHVRHEEQQAPTGLVRGPDSYVSPTTPAAAPARSRSPRRQRVETSSAQREAPTAPVASAATGRSARMHARGPAVRLASTSKGRGGLPQAISTTAARRYTSSTQRAVRASPDDASTVPRIGVISGATIIARSPCRGVAHHPAVAMIAASTSSIQKRVSFAPRRRRRTAGPAHARDSSSPPRASRLVCGRWALPPRVSCCERPGRASRSSRPPETGRARSA